MSSSSRPILALSFMLTVASATAAAQRQELASAVATNNAEVVFWLRNPYQARSERHRNQPCLLAPTWKSGSTLEVGLTA